MARHFRPILCALGLAANPRFFLVPAPPLRAPAAVPVETEQVSWLVPEPDRRWWSGRIPRADSFSADSVIVAAGVLAALALRRAAIATVAGADGTGSEEK